ncbi:MAG: D-Ala-D-Ala carboxypeptidase family metallohydrolase [Hyphomicrobiaceae bacterium]
MRTLSTSLRLAAIAVILVGTSVFAVGEASAKKRSAHRGSSCLPGVLRHRLSQIRAKFGHVRVISTFRRGARIAGTGRRSYHASCRAVDFHPPRGKYRAVAAWLKRNHGGGVGTYSCGLHHIHIDNGPRVRFHKCGKGRKRGKRYAGKRR